MGRGRGSSYASFPEASGQHRDWPQAPVCEGQPGFLSDGEEVGLGQEGEKGMRKWPWQGAWTGRSVERSEGAEPALAEGA